MKIGWCLTLFFFAASVQALTLTDDAGQPFMLQKPAQRIITLTPHATELMFAVGAGQQVVGAVDYSDYPADAEKIPRVGGYSGLNIEAILALQPDLIIYWPEGNPAREIQRLKQLKMPLYASDPNSFADIARSLEHYGEISGNVAKGQQAATQFRQRLNALQQRYAGAGKLRVFYQVWHQPLVTQSGDTFISRVLELCGGENIFADLPMRSPQISEEAVLAENPDVIIASGMAAERPEWLDHWRRYPHLNAVKHNHLYHVHPDLLHRPTPRLLDGAEQVCALLHRVRQKP
ncbi:ABC transporter substrate-binding protein [Oceanospirillaceae bacterium ASx5O]|nr:ABC transporter substrate-binding protein [Oceanospirillaceae bacterium ASx5O]